MSQELLALAAPGPASRQYCLPDLVLIRVPALQTPSALHSSRSAARPAVARRRRLRREVRLTATVLLLVAPLGFAILAFQAAKPEPQGVAARLTGIEGLGHATDEGPGLALPAAPAMHVSLPACEDDGAVVLPNYVLPDSGTEEPSHAGG
jgi:hypothetical protein